METEMLFLLERPTEPMNAVIEFVNELTRAKLAPGLLLSALEACPDAIAVAEDEMIVWSNVNFARLFGYSWPAELLGRRLAQLMSDPDFSLPQISDLHGTAPGSQAQNCGIGTHRGFARRKDGVLLILENTWNNFEFEDHKLLVVTSREIQSAKALNGTAVHDKGSAPDIANPLGVNPVAGKEGESADAPESRNLEAMGRLVGGVVHDFNNLLTAITLYSDLLLTGVKEQPSLRQHAEGIQLASERGAQLVQQLHSLTSQPVTGPKILSLNKVVEEMHALLSRLIGEHIRFEVRCAPDLGNIAADPVEMQRVLVTLVINARDALIEGGRLSVSTENLIVDAKLTGKYPELHPGPYVSLEVRDTGCGMDEQTQARLFLPFFTTKRPGKGSGIGLKNVQAIVRESGGSILVESRPSKGTRMRVLLPRVDSQAQRDHYEVPVMESGPGGRETVLLVEDDVSVRHSIQRVLREHGYKVLVARSSTHALEIARSHRHPIHLLLTDVVMPSMSGLELARQLRPVCPKTRVVYMSGYGTIGSNSNAVLFRKPFTGGALAHKLREVLGNVPVKKQAQALINPCTRGGNGRGLRREEC
jgi:signal transduction histidine kinase